MKLYEITNPSDPYTIQGEREICAAAVIMLGEGHYGLTCVDGTDDGLPIFLFANAAHVEGWWMEAFDCELSASLSRHAEIAEALDSVLIGDPTDRATYEVGLSLITNESNRAAWREKWHEDRRSSLNNIGARAWQLAELIRKAAA